MITESFDGITRSFVRTMVKQILDEEIKIAKNEVEIRVSESIDRLTTELMQRMDCEWKEKQIIFTIRPKY